MKILVLGGTGAARRLMPCLGTKAVLSLAGTTRQPLSVPHRVGGFGGVAGLKAYLAAEGFAGVIDATHPFAAQMSAHAFAACTALGLPLLRLEQPPWPSLPDWQRATDMKDAAARLPAGARVFLTVGSRSLAPFIGRADIWSLTRSIDPPEPAPCGQVLLQRAPFTLEHECALMKTHRISHLVSKNAGGTVTQAKVQAAAICGVRVIMVNRPRLPVVLTVESGAAAVKWVETLRD